MVCWMQMEVYQFEIRGHQVEMTFRKGYLAYTFERGGKTYGKKIKLDSRGVMPIVAATTLFVDDIYNTLTALEK